MESLKAPARPRAMRLLFAHDHRFHRGPDGGLYSVGSFPASIWDRYLRHFDHVTMIARDGGALPANSNMASTDHDAVEIAFMPNLASPRHLLLPSGAVQSQIRNAVAAANAIIARLPSEIGLKAAQEAHRQGKPYLIEVVGCALDAYGHYGSVVGRLFAPWAYRRMQRAVSKAPLVLYVTSSWLQGRYPTTGRQAGVSDVAVRALTFQERAGREARFAELAAGRPPRLGTVASLRTKTKGIQSAIAAIAALRREGVDLRYSVLGPGDPEPWHALSRKHAVDDLIRFDGTRRAGEGVRQWLDGIDIHLQPSFQEGLPRATIEAMSRGNACIGSTCGGIPELIPSERTHRPGDVQGLVNRIRQLADNPTMLAEAARADLARANEFEPTLLEARRQALYFALREMAEARL